jgi:hypothetical protein
MNEEAIEELNSLQKFDEFYKNNKNVEHEAYYYKKPRIDQTYYQADLTKIESKVEESK